MTKPTLLVMAAGMGSRYGGLKQIDPVGPSGETLMDYSIFDAIRAGFGKVVYVIRKDIEEPFKEIIGAKFELKRFVVETSALHPEQLTFIRRAGAGGTPTVDEQRSELPIVAQLRPSISLPEIRFTT